MVYTFSVVRQSNNDNPSHPMWVRGLKPSRSRTAPNPSICRTPCGCVDWNLLKNLDEIKNRLVAPHVGAWIETYYRAYHYAPCHCRTPCGCVDWNCLWFCCRFRHIWSHPMWVRGLKLVLYIVSLRHRLVAPHVGAWIETQCRILYWMSYYRKSVHHFNLKK